VRDAVATPSLELKWENLFEKASYGMGMRIGDLNCDTYPDLIVSDSFYATNTGKVDVYFGGNNFETTPDLTFLGEKSPSVLAYHKNFDIGDIDKDGCDDIIMGSPAIDSVGKVYIYKGNSSLTGTITVSTSTASLYDIGNLTDKKSLGYQPKFVDFNRDGYLDVVYIAQTSLSPTSARVLFFLSDEGGFDLTVPDQIITTSGTYAFGEYGGMVLDFNNDGYSDYLVADHTDRAEIRNIYLYGGGSVLPNTHNILFHQEVNGDALGLYASDSGGDINEDGYTDICMGAYNNDSTSTNSGRVYCWYGGSTFPTDLSADTADIILSGSEENLNYGRSLYLSDYNHDGNLDILIGATQVSSLVGSRHGRIYIHLGDGITFDSSPWISISDISEDGRYGTNVFSGDLNGNGWGEIVVKQYSPSKLYMYEISHGTSTITVDSSAYLTEKAVSGTTTEENASFTIGGVQWSSTNTAGGVWNGCTANDGTFDSMNEEFSCDLSSLSEGSNTIYFRSHDQDDLYIPEQEYVLASFIIDSIDPTGSILINGEDEFASSTSVTLGISADDSGGTGVSEMIICNDDSFADCSWEAYATSKTWTLTSGDGLKTVYAMFKDLAGNLSATTSEAIYLDQTAPTGSLVINDNNIHTSTTTVNLTILGSDDGSGINEMIICNNPEFIGCLWETFSTGTKTWILQDVDEEKTVYLILSDNIGNISTPISDEIILDTTVGEVVITQLGQISNIPNKNPLYYYFSDPKALIIGNGEVGSTVYFQVGSTIYTSTVDIDGKFAIYTDNPTLSYGVNTLTYYQVDLAGNTSVSRVITMVIGTQYFPSWLLGDSDQIQIENDSSKSTEDILDEEVEIDDDDGNEDSEGTEDTNYVDESEGEEVEMEKFRADGIFEGENLGRAILYFSPFAIIAIIVVIFYKKKKII